MLHWSYRDGTKSYCRLRRHLKEIHCVVGAAAESVRHFLKLVGFSSWSAWVWVEGEVNLMREVAKGGERKL